jgi:hypothetical protein
MPTPQEKLESFFPGEKFSTLDKIVNYQVFKSLDGTKDFQKVFQGAPGFREEVARPCFDYFQWIKKNKLPEQKLFKCLFQQDIPPGCDIGHVAGRCSIGSIYIFDKAGKQCFPVDTETFIFDSEDKKKLDAALMEKVLGELDLLLQKPSIKEDFQLSDFVTGLIDLKIRRFEYQFTEQLPPLDNFGNFSLFLETKIEEFRTSSKPVFHVPYQFVVLIGDFFFCTLTNTRFEQVKTILEQDSQLVTLNQVVTFQNLKKVQKPEQLTFYFTLNKIRIVFEFGLKKYENMRQTLLHKVQLAKYSEKKVGIVYPKEFPDGIKKKFRADQATSFLANLIGLFCTLERIEDSVTHPVVQIPDSVKQQVKQWVCQTKHKSLQEYYDMETSAKNVKTLN